MRKLARYLTPLLLVASLLLAACAPSRTESNRDAIYTSAALTNIAQLTLAVGATAVAQLTQIAQQPTATLAPPSPLPPTAMPDPTSPPPTPTPLPPTMPTSIPTPGRCDWVEFVQNVSVEDNTVFSPGVVFTKIWRVRNIGICTWTPAYALVFAGGNQMSGPSAVFLPGNVRPGEVVDLSVNLIAPPTAGVYRGDWLLRNPSGALFGTGPTAQQPLTVQIQVAQPPAQSNQVLVWNQQGGPSSVCQELRISLTDLSGSVAQARSCEGAGQDLGSDNLTESEQSQLMNWLVQLAPFEGEVFNADQGEPLISYMIFNGRGSGEARNPQITAMQTFAESVFNRITR